MLSRLVFKGFLSTLLYLPLLAQAEQNGKITDRFAKAYREQAANFSDELLVNKSNSPNWSWLWIQPQHVHGELVKRVENNQGKAITLTGLLLNSFEKSRNMYGTYVQSTFLQVLSVAAKDPQQLDLNFIKTTAIQLQNLNNVLRDVEDRLAIRDAQKIFADRFITNVAMALIKTKQFDRSFQFYQLLNEIGKQSNWLQDSTEFSLAKSLTVNQLFEIADQEHFEKLAQIYNRKDQALRVLPALSKMYKLNGPQTIDLVLKRIQNFDENRADFSTIIDEISFLKSHASKEILAILMPKLIRLLELAEKRKDTGTQALILDSIAGGGISIGGSYSNAIGTNGVSRPTWAQIRSGCTIATKCTSGANTVLALYRRGLIDSSEINFSLRELAVGDCETRENRVIAFGVIANICEEATRKQDTEVIGACYTDAFLPLLQWITNNRTHEKVQIVSEYLIRLFKVLPAQTISSLNQSCHIRIDIAAQYDKNEKLIEEGKTLYIQKTNGSLQIQSCENMSTKPMFAIRHGVQWSYGTESGISWEKERPASACIRDLIDSPTFKKLTDSININKETSNNEAAKKAPVAIGIPKTTTQDLMYEVFPRARVTSETTIEIPNAAPLSRDELCKYSYFSFGY